MRISRDGTRIGFLAALDGVLNVWVAPVSDPSAARAITSDDKRGISFYYDAATRALRVGDGKFSPVAPEIWEFSVSGYSIVKSWLDRRKREPSGRKSSSLDRIRPARWDFTQELLELLWVLEATLAMRGEGEALLDRVCAGPLFSADDLPTPTKAERDAPRRAGAQGALV